ncbi:hypothetical protein RJT34_30004 [Clitoria ternatea]|uniref:Uncharacterized protein n=1 Tax=Clitoria ternatea TaxID=43366 RepID=A0AAN9ESA3_CLITE
MILRCLKFGFYKYHRPFSCLTKHHSMCSKFCRWNYCWNSVVDDAVNIKHESQYYQIHANSALFHYPKPRHAIHVHFSLTITPKHIALCVGLYNTATHASISSPRFYAIRFQINHNTTGSVRLTRQTLSTPLTPIFSSLNN